MKKLIVLSAAAVLAVTSCKKGLESQFKTENNSANGLSNVSASKMADIQVPANFNWKTTENKSIRIVLKDNQDGSAGKQKVWISALIDNKAGQVIATGFTNANGEINFEVELPTALTNVIVNSNYLAVPKNVILDIKTAQSALTLGGKSPAMVQTLEEGYHTSNFSHGKTANKFNVVPSSRTWNSSGVPNYLMPTNDVVSNATLNAIAAALPNGVALSSNSPLLDPSKTRVIKLVDSCEVFVTFVSEGAGYLNSLFYYTYNVNNPPASINDIPHYSVVFANTSFVGSGGGMVTGNKVRLGNFAAGTVIGYGLAADGFKGGSNGFNGVTEGNWLVFGDKNLNPESNSNLKEHMVLMNDAANNRYIMGFEDIRRDNGSCDNDFNDALFYTTANPFNAIDPSNIPSIPGAGPDSDGDGVIDADDCEPSNASVANCNTYGTGTLAFEDQWPSQGDYDMNDVVVTYNYTVKTNAANVVTRVEASYTLRATGGSYLNGFGVQFPVDRSKVTSVVGATLEAGQTKAVLIPFTNMRNEMQMWNTVPGQNTSAVRTYNVSFNISNGPTLSQFGLSYYNPFIWNGTPGFGRGYEIHLPGKLPTDLANNSLFGTNRDASNVGSGDTYVSKNGRYPWGLNIPAGFDYPKEKADINTAYLKFASWVSSNGTQYTNWYTNGSGYRNAENIY